MALFQKLRHFQFEVGDEFMEVSWLKRNEIKASKLFFAQSFIDFPY